MRSLPVRMKIKHLCLKHTGLVSESPATFKSIYQSGIKLCFSNNAMLDDMSSPLQPQVSERIINHSRQSSA